jgi:hypothetical protein
MVGLRDILREPICKPEGLADPVADQATQPAQYSDQLPVVDQDLTDPVADQATQPIQRSDQLPVLTNAEVEEVLRGLEETFSAAEVEELLRGLGETSITDGSDGHYIDSEMNSVLNMCVEDYIV